MAFLKKGVPMRGSPSWAEQGPVSRAVTLEEFAAIATMMIGVCRVIWYEHRDSAGFFFPLDRRVSERSTDDRLFEVHIRTPRHRGMDMPTSGFGWKENECSVFAPCTEEQVRLLKRPGTRALIRPIMDVNEKRIEWSAKIISVQTSAFRF